jgi:SRSO17 transposase
MQSHHGLVEPDGPSGHRDLTSIEPPSAGLEVLHARIAGRFSRAEPRQRALAYMSGLLSQVNRKNGFQLAEQAGDPAPDGMQRLLATARWSADLVRDDLRSYVIENFGHQDSILTINRTVFPKKGTKSAGVACQWGPGNERAQSCQIGVFLGYANSSGQTFIDRELYLPQEWTDNAERRRSVGVPDGIPFRTESQLARLMLERALHAGMPARWVASEDTLICDRFMRTWLERRRLAYVLPIASTELLPAATHRGTIKISPGELVEQIQTSGWWPLEHCSESRERPFHEWIKVPLEWPGRPGMKHWLLGYYNLDDPAQLACYACFDPRRAALAELRRVVELSWSTARSIREAKIYVGLDQYEVRSWAGWYRHMTLALLSHAFLASTDTSHS